MVTSLKLGTRLLFLYYLCVLTLFHYYPIGTMDSSKCVSPETHEFRVPQRAVLSVEAMDTWLRSEAYLVSNILSLSA